MKLFLIKFTYAFLSCIVIIFLASCSILDFEEGQNKNKYSQNSVKKNKRIRKYCHFKHTEFWLLDPCTRPIAGQDAS